MAQSGYTPIQLYRTTTVSAAPTAGNLADGELAINTTDEKLYFKNAGGTVKLLASSAGAAGSVTSVAMTVPGFLSVSGSPITSSGTLAVTYSGTALPIANGGTNAAATPTAGAVAYGTGTAYAFTSAGSSGQVLTSNGAGAPTWQTSSGISTGKSIAMAMIFGF